MQTNSKVEDIWEAVYENLREKQVSIPKQYSH